MLPLRALRSLLAALSLLLAAAAPAPAQSGSPFNLRFNSHAGLSAISWNGTPSIVVSGFGYQTVATWYAPQHLCPTLSTLIGVKLQTEAVLAYDTRKPPCRAPFYLDGWRIFWTDAEWLLADRKTHSLPTFEFSLSPPDVTCMHTPPLEIGYCPKHAQCGGCASGVGYGPELWAVVFSIQFAR